MKRCKHEAAYLKKLIGGDWADCYCTDCGQGWCGYLDQRPPLWVQSLVKVANERRAAESADDAT